MPTSTPSCRDQLSREIYDPVTDPLTGLCYRNPCAAEEAGVRDWVPGCVMAEPVYSGSYEVAAPVDVGIDMWWTGGGRGGRGGRRRRRRPELPPPGGGRFGPSLPPPTRRPPGPSSGGGDRSLVRQSEGTLSRGRGGSLSYQPEQTLSRGRGGSLSYQPEQTLASRGPAPSYTSSYRTAAPPTGGIKRAGGYVAAPVTRAPPGPVSAPTTMSAAPRVAAVPRSTLKGLGQTSVARETLSTLTSSLALGVMGFAAAALVPPVAVGVWAGRRYRSVGRGVMAGAGTLMAETVLAVAYASFRRRARTVTTLPATPARPIALPIYIR